MAALAAGGSFANHRSAGPPVTPGATHLGGYGIKPQVRDSECLCVGLTRSAARQELWGAQWVQRVGWGRFPLP